MVQNVSGRFVLGPVVSESKRPGEHNIFVQYAEYLDKRIRRPSIYFILANIVYFPTMCRNQKVARVSGPKVSMCRRNNALTEKKSGPKRVRIERVVTKTYRDYSIGTKLK